MSPSPADPFALLTGKECQVLRLIVRGHDAKSAARRLDLSVHTVNDRLRDARRKLGVSSSREAARLLLDHEGGPDLLAPDRIGEAAAPAGGQAAPLPAGSGGRFRRLAWPATGVATMILVLSLLALAPQANSPVPAPAAAPEMQAAETAARRWLELVDQGRWEESWRGTGRSFRQLNTVAAWKAASEKARVPLGATVSRTLLSAEDVPAPPAGVRLVKFRTSFANRPDATETLTLDREGSEWRVVGIYLG